MVATAPPVRSWLLVEQPGPWGPQPVPDSSLPAAIKAALVAQAADLGARLLFIRRPGRTGHGSRRWGYADSVAGTLRWTAFTDPRELLDLDSAGTPFPERGELPDLDPAGGPFAERGELRDLNPAGTSFPERGELLGPDGGELDPLPLYLVCAHGGHDSCCAIRGRPAAAALAIARPGRVWECSHVGGDRFAGNVVVLPDGLYYGDVTADAAAALADTHDAGLLDLDLLRGHSIHPAPAQAAQHFARAKFRERATTSFPPLAVRRVAHEVWDVEFAELVLRVRAVFRRADTPLTCAATVPAAMRAFELVSVTDGPAAAP